MPMGGMSLDTQPATQGDGGRPAKKEERLSVVPVTVRTLADAAAVAKTSGGDSSVLIHKTEPGFVVVVGCVESVTKNATTAEIIINDATGRIMAKYFSNQGDSALESVEVGKYVTVAGNVRTSPAVHLSAQTLRLVRSADEISYHMIEAAHAMLKLTRPQLAMPTATKDVFMTPVVSATPPPKSSMQSAADVLMTPAKEPDAAVAAPVAAAAAAAPPMPAAKGGQALEGPALRNEVLKIITAMQSENPTEEGIHKDRVFQKLPATPQAAVEAMLKQLDSEGEIFSTISEDFYAPM